MIPCHLACLMGEVRLPPGKVRLTYCRPAALADARNGSASSVNPRGNGPATQELRPKTEDAPWREMRKNLRESSSASLAKARGRAPIVLAGVILVFAAVATSFLWSRFRGEVLSGAGFRLTEDSFEVTQQPPWIAATNVTSEAMVSGNLGALNLRQPDLTVRVGQAFAMHPWIRKVNHVTKRYPSRILVDVAYRQPVAMVEVTVMQQGSARSGPAPGRRRRDPLADGRFYSRISRYLPAHRRRRDDSR